MSRSSVYLQIVFFAALFLLIPSVLAQETTGGIVGGIKDSSGSTIAGARVSAVNEETDLEAQVLSDETGVFQFPLLRAGKYRLTVEAPGFQKLVRAGVVVNTTERVHLDMTLQVGGVNETVTVTAETPLLQSERATVGQVVEQRAIQSIPLATRNFTQILGTSAGVSGGIFNADSPGTGSNSVSVNGSRRGSNNLLVDGVQTTNSLNNAPDGDGTPSIDFLNEFKVLTSLYSAEYGRNSGSIINVTTKSGTNLFHGTMYEYLRNTDLNSRPFFNPKRVQNIQNQFGANVGGPIKRDKLFFWGGWETMRQLNAAGSGGVVTTVVPTLSQRQGNFQGFKTINDPSTGQPFPNNMIPQARLNPISLKIQEAFVPLPNYSSGNNNFFAAASNATNLDQGAGRIDYRIGDKDTLFGRWFESFEFDLTPFGKGMPGFTLGANRAKHTGGISWTHVFSPTFVLETKFGVDMTDQHLSFGNTTDPKSLGMQPIAGVTQIDGLPQINIANYVNGGFGNSALWHDNIKTFTLSETVTWVRGKHAIKLGGENVSTLLHPFNDQNNRGIFNYSGLASGNEYADFLLSQPATKQFSAGPGELLMREEIFSGFFDDSWKPTPNLTIEFGVRYEAHFMPAAYNLNMVSFWPDRYRGVGSLDGSGVVQGGVTPGVPNDVVFGNWHDFGPRLGIAYRMGAKTVIRTGAGVYYDSRTGQIAQQTFSNPPTFANITVNCALAGQSCNLKQPDNWTFVNPGYSATNIPFPTRTTDQIQLNAIQPHGKTDQVIQDNFTIQRELPAHLLVESGYVGTKGTHLMATQAINPLIPQPDGTLVRRYPGFGIITMTLQDGDSTYHSWQNTLKRRMGSSTFQLAYTVSKTLGNGNESARFFTNLYPAPWSNTRLAKGPANFDRPQRLALTWVQDLPSKANSRLGKALLNNWSINGFFIAQSGYPLTVINTSSGQGLGGTTSNDNGNYNANVLSGIPLIHPTGSTKDNLQSYINKAAFYPAPAGTYGNSGRGILRGPGQWNVDGSVFKDFTFTERWRLQFRTEFFNLLNHANFALASDTSTSLNLNSSTFGQIGSTSVNARLIQLALRLSF
jgi:Carboxypeptidase regulatory-like domain/TonB-dependent Receptor Plug Domain